MTHVFPSESWTLAYKDALNACPAYADAAKTWTHGAIALAVRPAPEVGLPDGYVVFLDVEGGRCRGAWRATAEEAAAAPFCITATYDRWVDVIQSRLDPIAGMVTRRLELRGSLVTMLRYVRSAQAMVRCAARVPATPREKSPVTAGGVA